MKFRTLNSEYELKDQQLFRNGELYTDKVTYTAGFNLDNDCINIGTPKVGGLLYVEYLKDGHKRCIRTSTIQEVCD